VKLTNLNGFKERLKNKKLAKYSETAQTVSLSQKRKIVRPQNNTPALIKQPSEAYNKKSQSFKRYTDNQDSLFSISCTKQKKIKN
jgi:hypothetical protein